MNKHKKSILVTGAGGFVGRQCLSPLSEMGYEVHAVSRNDLNLLDSSERTRLIETVMPDVILHSAWYTEHGQYWHSPKNQEWLTASIDLFEKAVKNGTQRIVAVGSCAEYDWSDNSNNYLKETDVCKPHTLYGQSKLALKEILEKLGVDYAWARLFLLFGENENPARLVPSIICKLLRDEPALCTSGRQVRDFMDIRDVGAALAMLADSRIQGVINIASGQPVSVKDIAETLGKILGKPELIRLNALPDRENEPPFIVADTSRLFDELHFSFPKSLEQRLEETSAWWCPAVKKQLI